MKHKTLLWIVLLTVTASLCRGLGQPVEAPLAQPEKLFDYEQTTLDNGLTVITLEDFSCPIVAVQVWYNVGSKNEKPDRQGYAHMFEHMMFKGTDRVSEKDHFDLIRKVGGTCNAYTSFDRTVYHETLPADQVELALWLEAERMSFLTINQQAFDTERNVVQEELRMGENKPYGTLFKKMAKEIFGSHPYHWTPIGNLAHLRATSVADLRQFWQTYYVPNNATLIIVGAIRHEQARQLADRYFGWIHPGDEPPAVRAVDPLPTTARQVVIDNENAPAGQVILTWRTVPTGTRDEVVLDCLSQILGSGQSSRIYRALVAESQMAVDAGTWAYHLQQDGLFAAEATLPQTADNYDAVTAALKAQIQTLQKSGVTETELEKARNQLLKELVTTNLTINSKAALLGNAAVTMGDVSRVNQLIAEIRSVTTDDIRRAARTYLPFNRAVEFTVLRNAGMEHAQKDNEDAPITAEPELTAPPAGRPGLERPDNYPKEPPLAEKNVVKVTLDYAETTLDNGLTVLTVTNHEVPFVSATLGLTNGAWTETKPAAAAMAMAMLKKGTTGHTEGELAAELDQYAISLTASATMDSSTVAMNCLTEQLGRGMGLLAEVTLEPTFDAAEFDKLRRQEITGLEIQSQQPRYLANKYFSRVLFGAHPYSRQVLDSVADLEALTVGDLKQWWATFVRPDQATLIVAGDVTEAQAVALARDTLGTWRVAEAKPAVALPAIADPDATRIYIVNRPGSVQAQITVGQLGITRRQQPDYFTSLIAGNYFGGSFNSRLNETLRVKRGLTYGAFGGFRPKAQAGTFEISTFTKNESVAEAVTVILEQIAGFQTVPPTDAEFYDTRSSITGSFARNRETPQDVAGDLWMMQSERLDRDYFDKLFETLAAITPQDCLDLAARRIDRDELVIVIVGDAAALKEPLAAIAPVEIIEPAAETAAGPAR